MLIHLGVAYGQGWALARPGRALAAASTPRRRGCAASCARRSTKIVPLGTPPAAAEGGLMAPSTLTVLARLGTMFERTASRARRRRAQGGARGRGARDRRGARLPRRRRSTSTARVRRHAHCGRRRLGRLGAASSSGRSRRATPGRRCWPSASAAARAPTSSPTASSTGTRWASTPTCRTSSRPTTRTPGCPATRCSCRCATPASSCSAWSRSTSPRRGCVRPTTSSTCW